MKSRTGITSSLIMTSSLLLALATLCAQPALAHVVDGESVSWLGGLMHPLSGWDHVLPMLAVGLWAAQMGAPAIWLLPVAFPLVMAIGGVLGFIGVPVPCIEIWIAVSAVVLGGAVMFEERPSLVGATLLVGSFALIHGHAHGTELPPEQSVVLYSLGFMVSTAALQVLGIGIGTLHRWAWGRKLLRAAGAAVTVSGVFFMLKVFD
jgi:urease accessory protein